jgi:Type II secretion system (T2SS), protein E, N-terminal domain
MAKLGQLLVARGWITVQQLTRALKNQNVAGGRLGTCLLEMDALSEDLLLKGLAEQHGVPAAGPDDLRGVPDEVLQLIPDKLARRLRCVPFRVEGSRLDLAVTDPRNLSAQDEIAFASGKRVKVFVAPEIRILEALEKYYGEECPSRFGNVLDRLNRARFLWAKPTPAPQPELTQPMLHSAFDPPPALRMPPHLPELAPPQPSGPIPLMPAMPPIPAVPATVMPAQVTPGRPAASAPRPAAVAASLLAAAGAAASAPAVLEEPPPATLEAPAAPTAIPLPKPPPLPRANSVSLTPEERVELGAFSWVGPAAGSSGQAPVSLDEAKEALGKAGDLDQVGEVLLGFLGRIYRRAALFHVTRDRVAGWRIHGMGIDREAFGKYSVGFDQPSLFLNLRQGSSLYLGPLPPMPAHRQLARTWGGDLPRDCIMMPVRVKDRMVLVLYADGATGGTISLPTLQQLTAAATAAVERCILARKHGEAR